MNVTSPNICPPETVEEVHGPWELVFYHGSQEAWRGPAWRSTARPCPGCRGVFHAAPDRSCLAVQTGAALRWEIIHNVRESSWAPVVDIDHVKAALDG